MAFGSGAGPALEDEESDVRWLAAIALTALGDVGLVATLRAMASVASDLTHHHASHLELHDVADAGRDDVAPVLAAREGPAPGSAATVAAAEPLRQLAHSRAAAWVPGSRARRTQRTRRSRAQPTRT